MTSKAFDMSMFSLAGRTAVVTGGGRGIGKGICAALSAAGANIVVAEINEETGRAEAEEINESGGTALFLHTNVRDRSSVETTMEKTVERFGGIDILVNNAGGANPRQMVGPLEIDDDTWDNILELNLKSAFICCQTVSRVMIEQKRGSIINMASLTGLFPFTQGMHYAAAKAGVMNMTRTMASLLGGHGIRVNALVPGFFVTEYTTELTYGAHPEQTAIRSGFVALQRLGYPEDIGGVAVFLASDASAYISAQSISVDGGFPHFPVGIPKNED